MFGDKFYELMKEREVNISRLCADLGIKSRNTFYMMRDGKYGLERCLEIAKQAAKLEWVKITEAEVEALYAAEAENKRAPHTLRAYKVLQGLYEKREKQSVFDENEGKRYDGAEVYVFNLQSESSIDYIEEGLANFNVKVYQFIDFLGSDYDIALEMAALMRLGAFKNYIPLKYRHAVGSGAVIMGRKGEKRYMNIVDWTNSGAMESESEVSAVFYERMDTHFKNLVMVSENMRNSRGKLTDLILMLNEYNVFAQNYTINATGTLCFGDVDAEILCRMLSDANYLGFDKNADFIKRLMAAARERTKLIKADATGKKYILSKAALEQFAKTKRMAEHMDVLPDFTDRESVNVLEELIGEREKNPERRVRFLKDEYEIGVMGIRLTEGKMMLNVTKDMHYDRDTALITVTNYKAIRLMKGFLEDELWEKCCEDEESGIQRLEEYAIKLKKDELEAK